MEVSHSLNRASPSKRTQFHLAFILEFSGPPSMCAFINFSQPFNEVQSF